MNDQIFISYAQEDRRAADVLRDALARAGLRGWVAHHDLKPGVTWSEKLVDALHSSRVLILLLSRASNASQYVIREVTEATDARLPIITVRLENVEPSKALKFFIGSTQWLDVVGQTPEGYVGRVVQAVQRVLTPSEQTAPRPVMRLPDTTRDPTAAKFPVSRPSLQRRSVVAAITLLAASGLGAWGVNAGWFGGGSNPPDLVIVPPAGPWTVGETFRLQAQLGGQSAPVRWSSGNEAIVRLTADSALFLAVGAGTAYLYAEAEGQRDSTSVTIAAPKVASSASVVASLRIQGRTRVTAGDSTLLRVHAYDSLNREIRPVTARWSTRTPALLALDSSGVAHAKRAGRAHVRAQAGEVFADAEITIAAAPIASPPVTDPIVRDSQPADPVLNTGPRESDLRGLVKDCTDAIQRRDTTWLRTHYRADNATDFENLRALNKLVREANFRIDRTEVYAPDVRAASIDFGADFSFRHFTGARRSAKGTFRIIAQAEGQNWQVKSCKVNVLTAG